jgi:hypothetical protein
MSVVTNNDNESIKGNFSQQNYCANCGTNVVEGTKFCTHCGSIISNNVNELKEYINTQQKSSLTKQDSDKKILMTLFSTTAIWLSVVLSGLFAPDLVSGSEQQHLSLVLWTGWMWGLIATVFAFRLHRDQIDMKIFTFQTIAITGLWLFVTVVSIFAPPFVTGSDPTSIPMASLIAPLIGSILTAGVWFLGKPTSYY